MVTPLSLVPSALSITTQYVAVHFRLPFLLTLVLLIFHLELVLCVRFPAVSDLSSSSEFGWIMLKLGVSDFFVCLVFFCAVEWVLSSWNSCFTFSMMVNLTILFHLDPWVKHYTVTFFLSFCFPVFSSECRIYFLEVLFGRHHNFIVFCGLGLKCSYGPSLWWTLFWHWASLEIYSYHAAYLFLSILTTFYFSHPQVLFFLLSV